MTPMIDSVIIELSGGYLGKIGSSARFSQEMATRYDSEIIRALVKNRITQ